MKTIYILIFKKIVFNVFKFNEKIYKKKLEKTFYFLLNYKN